MKIKQIGDYTLYCEMHLHSDVIVNPHPCTGADMIFLSGTIQDTAQVLAIISINEEQYKQLQAVTTQESLSTFIQQVWAARSLSHEHHR